MLTFDEHNHAYRWQDRIVPCVTTVLKEFIKFQQFGDTFYLHTATGNVIPGDVMDRAAKIGSAIHKGMYYLFTGQGLSWDSLDPQLEGALRQGQQFVEDFQPGAEICEKPLYSHQHGYAGTPDFYGTIKGCKGKALIDIKTSSYSRTVGYQTAAYEGLIREETKYLGVIDRYVLILPRDGEKYQLIPLTGKQDFQAFLMKLQLFKLEG